MKNIYIHPNSNSKFISFNPYISNLNNSISPYCNIVNRNSMSNSGIFHIFKFLPRLNYIWFNWIEDLPDKRGGFFQSAVLVFILLYCRAASIKVIWTIHNKFSHYKKNRSIKRFLFWLLMNESNFILTHSSEGIDFAEGFGTKIKAKVKFFHHPVNNDLNPHLRKKTIDILIWGSMIPYKGIDRFLEYLKLNNLEHRWQIKVIGKIPDPSYQEKLFSYANEKIIVENKFIDYDTLKEEIAASKSVLFTYLKDSVLSSGSLMDSISMGAKVIGPKCGAFSDLSKEGIVLTYQDYDELSKILISLDEVNDFEIRKKTETFILENTWATFGKNIASWLKL